MNRREYPGTASRAAVSCGAGGGSSTAARSGAGALRFTILRANRGCDALRRGRLGRSRRRRGSARDGRGRRNRGARSDSPWDEARQPRPTARLDVERRDIRIDLRVLGAHDEPLALLETVARVRSAARCPSSRGSVMTLPTAADRHREQREDQLPRLGSSRRVRAARDGFSLFSRENPPSLPWSRHASAMSSLPSRRGT